MVNPNLGRCLDVDKIRAYRGPVELQVPDDDVVGLLDPEPTICNASIFANAENRSVRFELDDAAALQGAFDLDHTASLRSSGQLRAAGDSGA